MPEPSVPHVKSALRTLDIIEYVVGQRQPVTAQDIGSALVIPVSSLSYLLATLVERGYLKRDGRRYCSGNGLERLLARSSIVSLKDRVTPLVRSLRVQLNETASFFVRRDWELETLVTETSDHALRYATQHGSHNAMHAFAAGKAILAALPPQELDCYFRAVVPFGRFTPATIVTEAALRADLEEARRTGLARTREEYSLGIQGVGRALVVDGELLGAFSIAVPNVRFDNDMEQRVAKSLKLTVALLHAG